MARLATPPVRGAGFGGKGGVAGHALLRYKQAMNPLETYLEDMGRKRSFGGGDPETTYYGTLERLLEEIGKSLKPKVHCLIILENRGAGKPDGGLYTANQCQRGTDAERVKGQLPERGAIEVKPPSEPVEIVADTKQVKKYFAKYGSVLVTNYRDFLLLGQDTRGNAIPTERYTLADTESAFWQAAAHPQKPAKEHGERFCEYLKRVMLSVAPLSAPQDVAWFLGSYARDAKARVEDHKDLSALAAVRDALQEALGMKFTGEKGEHFFRSTLVQTIFYGVFSAWVLWHRERPDRADAFDWRVSAWSLRVPFIRALYDEVATPSRLGPLGLVDVLNLTAGTLNRVNRAAFFQKFQDEHAVQYFYEPFMEAYDPDLQKELGVWYTPLEIVRYQVARVHAVLREELGLPDGLADPNVIVLDPCCGTGAYLVEVLKRIADTLKAKGGDALIASDLKRAAMTRVFGFEILPAPFVVSHLQLGLLLHDLGAPLSGKGDKQERVGVYLTNSLTGWEPPKEPKKLLFPELAAERDAANNVKQEAPILVILGNPPYNGFADVAVEEERDLSLAYRTAKKAPKPKGQGLNDLYVRFFRMAERRIVEKTGKGVVCFISNYSWLDGLSHTGMRERYIEAFDRIWIDCLNGDKYKTGKLTPDGKPDPSVFSTESNREGIQVGTAIALMVCKKNVAQAPSAGAGDEAQATAGVPHVRFRHLWGKEKRAELLASADNDGKSLYELLSPPVQLGYPFRPGVVASAYLQWPLLTDLLPVSFSGVQSKQDQLVADIDKERLAGRLRDYLDKAISHEEMARKHAGSMDGSYACDAIPTRELLQKRGFQEDRLVPYLYRPFDMRWIYWESEAKLIASKSPDFLPNVFKGNGFIEARKRESISEWTRATYVTALADNFGNGFSNFFPIYVLGARSKTLFGGGDTSTPRPNLSERAAAYLQGLRFADLSKAAECLFHHILAILHAPAYRSENAGALRQDWPRVPLPATREAMEASAALGRQIAALLDVQQPISGVTTSSIREELKTIGSITHVEGKQINDPEDLTATAGWGNPGRGGVCMPGPGDAREKAYLAGESQTPLTLGKSTLDIFLNERVYWRNIPAGVWEYTLGGYQVIKKWLSYRDHRILGRPLRPDEARYVTEMARRIAAILLLRPVLDENYACVKDSIS